MEESLASQVRPAAWPVVARKQSRTEVYDSLHRGLKSAPPGSAYALPVPEGTTNDDFRSAIHQAMQRRGMHVATTLLGGEMFVRTIAPGTRRMRAGAAEAVGAAG